MAARADRTATVLKHDGSPQTCADREADLLITARLRRLEPGIPILSEESVTSLPADACRGSFILVDPLDGTREFVRGLPEFTINIAVVAEGRPAIGVVFAPALGELFVADGDGARAYRLDPSTCSQIGAEKPLRICRAESPALSAVTSRSHTDESTEALLRQLAVKERRACGSSLKFCRLAEGKADLYPRLSPTMEWDTAAGQAILEAAGGVVLTVAAEPLAYGKSGVGFRNPGFIAAVSAPLARRAAEAARLG